ELSRVMTSIPLRAHSSTAERPAHNRSGLGSNPGGPTSVSQHEVASHRGWPEIEGRGWASVSEHEVASHRGWPEIDAGGCAPRSTVPASACGFAPQSTVLSMETTWTHSSKRS